MKNYLSYLLIPVYMFQMVEVDAMQEDKKVEAVELALEQLSLELKAAEPELSKDEADKLYWDSAPFGKSYGDPSYLKSHKEWLENMWKAVPVLHKHNILPQHHYYDPLPTAVLSRNVEFVQLFIKCGYDPKFRSMTNCTSYDMLQRKPGLYLKDDEEQKKITDEEDIILKEEIKKILDSYQPQSDLEKVEVELGR